MKFDLVLLHPPSVYDFRKKSLLVGPISDVVPSSPVFEMYPIGLTSIADYLERYGYRVKIINLANRMLLNPNFDVEKKLKKIKTKAFGIDLHWLPHAHGSIEIAKLVKKYHPDKPVFFGGLSSTYFHKELIKSPYIDFVFRGDSTEKLVHQLMDQLKTGEENYEIIPNLTWKKDDTYIFNPHTYVADNMDEFDIPGYQYVIRSVFKYRNFIDPLPYVDWLKYPNTALLTSKGCNFNCLICGGSKTSYELMCNRRNIAMRSPEKLEKDIVFIQRFSRAPIFLLNDIRQGGKEYVSELLNRFKQRDLKNELVFELFYAAGDEFFGELDKALPKYSIEITLESHDEELRRTNGKFNCTNEKVIETIKSALKYNCSKIDLFFMVGIPGQDYESALKNVEFCEEIHLKCNQDTRLSYFIAPLAPFLDPASPAFENPELHGYKKFCHTVEDHREALLQPSWKYMLSYETEFLTRDEIVRATYNSALALNSFKFKYKLIDEKTYEQVKTKINYSLEFIDKIDRIMELPEEQKTSALEEIKNDVRELNSYSICGKDELKWEVKKNYANPLSLTIVGLELLLKDKINSLKNMKEYFS
ncbi:TIGR04190 family B12-binding domain/radical SAM domain protein [Anaerobacillus sp. CMMVII]|uniref:TIGR04190 family B12-binding domain/radical SAM domain protein n=1 Tax=Anaerobacillus sp. CMMVII TaxID=2755588 RepID=UPI0021B78AD1|nr:TIGR04190 family B12-binding domain/radical SAM domain protein [Anaerobacillus sp. CMMVII]MCT8139066.1 TIGR04190 family B12-binding domain/radical SAM domain protein [Anaerobacillus sp. CMMVII]